MINLNLLSPTHKTNLRVRVVYSMIEQAMIILVALVLSLTVGLLTMKIRLTGILGATTDRQILSAEYATANNDTQNLNASVSKIERLQDEFVPVSRLISDLSVRTVRNVTLSGIVFETRTGSLTVSGHAATRDDLLEYEAALRGSPFVEQLDSQLSNLLQRVDITFQLKAILDVDAVKMILDEPEAAATP